MLDPIWMLLSTVALVAGIMIILAPKAVVSANKQMSKVLLSVDDLVIRYRHIVGIALLIVGYLCFRIALLLSLGSI